MNTSAILFDVNRFSHHIVVAGKNNASTLRGENFGEEKGINLWGSKVGQAALMENDRVVHFIFNGSDIDKLNPDLSDITSKIDLGEGSINMFEVFGDTDMELTLFPMQMEKLKLIAEMGYSTTPEERSIVKGSLEGILTDFYIDNNMWQENAKENRHLLRLTGIPHNEVPRLPAFAAYVEQKYKEQSQRSARDEQQLRAYNILRFLFKNMLTSNGDLFDCTTTDIVDKAKNNRRVIYDFSKLKLRGEGIAMAQFVNVFWFAISNLKKGDLIVFHGAEDINDSVKSYVADNLELVYNRGVRTAFLYKDVDTMIRDSDLNKFDEASYTVLGKMSAKTAEAYRKALMQDIPNILLSNLIDGSDLTYYIRRGFNNVLFNLDFNLGINPELFEEQ